MKCIQLWLPDESKNNERILRKNFQVKINKKDQARIEELERMVYNLDIENEFLTKTLGYYERMSLGEEMEI